MNESDPHRVDSSAGARRGLIHRLHAAGVARGCRRHEQAVERYKRALLGSLSGTVVEIGPGAGVNLSYYPAHVRWIGIEPNVHMHRYLHAEAERLGRDIEVHGVIAERIDLPDASADAVVSTLVLCSVTDVAGVLAEVQRILKPGGRFLFIEHVAAPRGTWRRRLQRLLRPFWRIAGDGCRPDQETGALVRHAGFADVDIDSFTVPLPVVGPHIAGVAEKRA